LRYCAFGVKGFAMFRSLLLLVLLLVACATVPTPTVVPTTALPATVDPSATAQPPVTGTVPPATTSTATITSTQTATRSTATATPTRTPNATATPASLFELGGQIFTFAYDGQIKGAGMTWVKMQLNFSYGSTTADAQNILNYGREHNFKILLSIKGNMGQLAANPNGFYDAYAAFVASVARLGPAAIEVWNEPNIDREWPAGMISGTQYTQLLSRAYPAIKAANPAVMVISGAPAPTGYFGGRCTNNGCDDNIFIQQMRDAGAASYFDCTGLHYNEGVLPPTASSGDPRGSSDHYSRYYPTMISTYRAVFPTKPICFTEIGYLSPEGLSSLPAGYQWGTNTSLQEQAEWLAQAARLSRDGGIVRLMIVWNMDASIYGSDPMAGWAIIRQNQCRACATLGTVMRE
jgi:hypothetical protein